jgi:hypothetical protein
MNTRERILLVIAIFMMCVHGQCVKASDQEIVWVSPSLPLARIVEDSTAPFPIDPTKPFVLGLGRGSGMHGLQIIRITEEGEALLHRQYRRHDEEKGTHLIWKAGRLQLSDEVIQEVIEALSTYHLFTLHRGYYANAFDGGQWIFFVRQERHGKGVYCDNHFPDPMIAFADWLDTMLTQQGIDNIVWEIVSEEEKQQYDNEFWSSVPRK